MAGFFLPGSLLPRHNLLFFSGGFRDDKEKN